MQRIEGLHLPVWLANKPSQAERNHFGQLLFDWFWTYVSDLGRLHADPHAGNFLFVPKENTCDENPFGKLAVLDFGCTKTLSPEFCASMKWCWQTWRSKSVAFCLFRRDIFCRTILCLCKRNPFSLRTNTKPSRILTCSF